MTSVLLVDDHWLLLEGLNNLLTAQGIEVAGMADNGPEAMELAQALRPDVILMDIRMPGWDGLETTRRIIAQMPDAKIVILTTSAEEHDFFEAIKSGAFGYLLKSMDADELVEALAQAKEGVPPFSPGLAAILLIEFARLAEEKTVDSETQNRKDGGTARREDVEEKALTAREREVLKLVAGGMSYKEVGAQLNLSPRTIKYHMAEIMNRLHLEHRAQVLAYAGRIGLAHSDK
jgi:two-component system NarL family response regulator